MSLKLIFVHILYKMVIIQYNYLPHKESIISYIPLKIKLYYVHCVIFLIAVVHT